MRAPLARWLCSANHTAVSRMADQETANAGLEKVTDYVDEQELNADDTADALKNLAANPGARYRRWSCVP